MAYCMGNESTREITDIVTNQIQVFGGILSVLWRSLHSLKSQDTIVFITNLGVGTKGSGVENFAC